VSTATWKNCRHHERQVQQLLQRKLADLDARLIELQEFGRTLNAC
jgi:hypothetical protein